MSPPPLNHEGLLHRLNEQIEARMNDVQFGVNELAREMGMSRSNLHRKIKSLTGLSISKYICQVRLGRAKELLKDSSLTISEIAFESGFHSVTYFNKCFRDHFGYPPGETRKIESGIDLKTGLLHHESKSDIGKKRVSVIYLITTAFVLILLIALNIFFKPFSAAKEPGDKSIAVLPFINDSPEESEMYFINGTMEAILDNLGRIEELRVVSRTSVEQYRNNPRPVIEIGKEMNVSYVVEGSGLKHGNNIRLTIQLIDAINDRHIWSNTFDRKIEDIFELQSEIAQIVASEIEVIITPEEKNLIENIPTTNQTAYELYLRARDEIHYFVNKATLDHGLQLLRNSIDLDPDFADPYALIGWIFDVFHDRNPMDIHNYLDSVLVYANRALALDDHLALAYEIKGSYYRDKGPTSEAIKYYDKALEMNPNSHTAYFGKGWFLFEQDDFIPAIQNFHHATLLDRGEYLPSSLINLGFAYNQAGFPDKFMEILQETLVLTGDSVTFYKLMSLAYRAAGKFPEGLVAAQKAYALNSSDLITLENLMVIHANLDQTGEALHYCELYLDRMEALRQFVPYNLPLAADLLMQAGHIERANNYMNLLIEYHQDKQTGQSVGRLGDLLAISALKKEYEDVDYYLSEIARKERLNVWVLSIRNNPFFNDPGTNPEFLRIIDEIENKFELQRERDRKWLEEHDLI